MKNSHSNEYFPKMGLVPLDLTVPISSVADAGFQNRGVPVDSEFGGSSLQKIRCKEKCFNSFLLATIFPIYSSSLGKLSSLNIFYLLILKHNLYPK